MAVIINSIPFKMVELGTTEPIIYKYMHVHVQILTNSSARQISRFLSLTKLH